jgi:uncharacterized protein YukE
MGSYAFNPNGALDTRAELAQVTAKLRESLDALGVAVRAFNAANSGSAIEGFDQVQTRWNAAHADMQRAVAAGGGALDDIHENYVLTDRRGAAAFHGAI